MTNGSDVCEQTSTCTDVTAGGHLGHSDQETIKFLSLGEVRREFSKTWIFRGQMSAYLEDWLRLPWEATRKGKGVQEGWTVKEMLKVQEQDVFMCAK